MHVIAAMLLGLLLITAGVSHFLAPAYFRALVPDRLPKPGLLVIGSGLVEILLGCIVLLPLTRALGGWLAAGLLAGYLLVWLDRLRNAWRGDPRRMNRPPAAAAGVAVNAAYVAWASYVGIAGQ